MGTHRSWRSSFVPAAVSAAAVLAAVLTGCAAVAVTPTSWAGASGDPRVINVPEATFAPGSRVTAAVLAECGLERRIPEYVARWSPVPVVLATDPAGAVRVLELEVLDIWAPRGGAWTGPKSLTVRGELREREAEGWVLVGSFEARRTTARVGGTWEMLETVANTIGKDVRAWLVNPSLNAPLGEL
jgi:hypothetical protein